jgi:hypothetical protein
MITISFSRSSTWCDKLIAVTRPGRHPRYRGPHRCSLKLDRQARLSLFSAGCFYLRIWFVVAPKIRP